MNTDIISLSEIEQFVIIDAKRWIHNLVNLIDDRNVTLELLNRLINQFLNNEKISTRHIILTSAYIDSMITAFLQTYNIDQQIHFIQLYHIENIKTVSMVNLSEQIHQICYDLLMNMIKLHVRLLQKNLNTFVSFYCHTFSPDHIIINYNPSVENTNEQLRDESTKYYYFPISYYAPIECYLFYSESAVIESESKCCIPSADQLKNGLLIEETYNKQKKTYDDCIASVECSFKNHCEEHPVDPLELVPIYRDLITAENTIQELQIKYMKEMNYYPLPQIFKIKN